MRKIFLLPVLAGLVVSCSNKPSGSSTPVINESRNDTVALDTTLIRFLHADEYGMKKYVMALLKAGPNRDQDSATAEKLQAAHLANIGRLAKEGKLVIAGPFLDDMEIKGIYIFNVESIEEAKALTETDPAIQAGRLVMELHPWYGSAALQKIPELHERIQTTKF